MVSEWRLRSRRKLVVADANFSPVRIGGGADTKILIHESPDYCFPTPGLSNSMRLYEFASSKLFDLPAPPIYTAAERKLYRPKPQRVSISAFAPTRSSAVRLAMLKQSWQQWRARDRNKKNLRPRHNHWCYEMMSGLKDLYLLAVKKYNIAAVITTHFATHHF